MVLLLAAGACSAAPPCENSVRTRALSPDGRHDAVVFVRACGATTADSVQLSIEARGTVPAATGNVLVADGVVPRAVAVRWLTANTLSVALPASARTFHTADAVGGVRIVYRRSSEREVSPGG